MNEKLFYVVGNWKSNKTIVEAADWVKEFALLWKKKPVRTQALKIILCPAALHLSTVASLIKLYYLPLELGLQDVSAYPSGPYTGQISAVMVSGLAKYSLVGHSERRKYCGEKEPELKAKCIQAKGSGIEPVYCVQSEDALVPEGIEIVAYEPVWAIGTGKPDSPENANRVGAQIKQRFASVATIIYGGSVTAENVAAYAHKNQANINGVLPGGASLSPLSFYRLIQVCSHHFVNAD